MDNAKTIINNLLPIEREKVWTWWSDQLLSGLPIGLQRVFRTHKGYVRFQITPNGINVMQQHIDKPEDANKFSIANEVLAELPKDNTLCNIILGNFNPHSTCIEVCLHPDEVLYTVPTFPVEVEENIGQVLEFEMDDYSPFRPEKAYFHYHVVHRNQNKIYVQVALISRKAIDQLQQQLGQWYIQENSIYLLMPGEDFFSTTNARQINLIPPEKRRLQNKALRHINKWLAAIAIILTGVALFIPFFHKYQKINYLANEVQQLQLGVQQVGRLEGQLSALINSRNLLDNKKKQSSLVIQSIGELTRVIDDKTWVVNFQQDESSIRIRGFAPVASTVIEKVEKSQLFENAVFRAAITKDKATGYESFLVWADLAAKQNNEPNQ